jgi:ribonucleoside-diphosphate reductase alpha chain
MRTLSLIARDGGPVAKALADRRQAVWERGPVRCGQMPRHSDGVLVPVFHDSVVAAIAYMFQQILIKRGFLDDQGNQVPVQQLAARHRPSSPLSAAATTPVSPAAAQVGAKCPDCKARALQKVDGCQRCQNCHYIGSCG